MLEDLVMIKSAMFAVVVLSQLVFANEKLLGNSTVPDANVFKCTWDVQVGEIPSQIDLCSLKGNQILTQQTSPGEKSSSIKIQRYYCINPFGRIQSTSSGHKTSMLPDLSDTNCPLESTSCLVSQVTFLCNSDQDGDGVCLKDQITADSYGYQRKWVQPIVVYPPESSGLMKGSTAVITMEGGPCYYCDSREKLHTVIGFYCDERRMGQGTPMIKQNPSKSNPKVFVQWNTSAACYDFRPKQKCTYPDFFKTNCPSPKPLISCNPNHKYNLPPSANKSINFTTDSNITYAFGFCAMDVHCPTADKNVMICRKDGQESKALAYYSDSIDLVARPTGFVIQIREPLLLGSSLKAVISFECSSQSTGDIRHMDVLDNDDLPILLTLKHGCFCPDNQSCQTGPPKKETVIGDAKPVSPNRIALIVLSIAGGIVVLFGAIFIYARFKIRPTHNIGDDDGNDDVGDGNDGQPVANEGDALLDSPPSSTYHSCKSDDSLFSCLSRKSNVSDLQSDGETLPQDEVNGSQTRESRM